MKRFIGWLFGLEEGALDSVSAFSLEFVYNPLVLLFLAAVVFLGAMWIYRREAGSVPKGVRIFLAGTRFLCILIVLAFLFEPILAVEKTETQDATVLVLVDDSLSMTIQGNEYADTEERLKVARFLSEDPSLTMIPPTLDEKMKNMTRYELAQGVLGRTELLQKLSETHRVRLQVFSSRLQMLGEGSPEGEPFPETIEFPEPSGRITKLGDLLRQSVQALRGQPIVGVVLLTDGQSNSGEDPVSVARFAGSRKPSIPIYSIGIGSDRQQQDVTVAHVFANPVALEGGDPHVFKAVVKSTGYAGEMATVRLLRSRGDQEPVEVDHKSVTLVDGPTGVEVELQDQPDEEGSYAYRVEIEPLPGELLSDNNALAQTVKVIEEKMKVLFVEGAPRWEYRRLVSLLMRNKEVIDSSALLVSADREWPQEGTKPIDKFPDSFQELYDNYDLIILGDVDSTAFNPEHLENIEKFTEEGGGLVVISGERFMPFTYKNTPLEDMLPVVVEGRADRFREPIKTAFPVRPTPRGLEHPILQIDQTPEENAASWEKIAGTYWFQRFEQTKPLAEILAEHPFEKNRDGKPYPILMFRRYGRGQVLMLATDETWRWSLGFPEESVYHPFNRFWGQAIRFLSMEKLLGGGREIQITVDKSEYSVGDKVLITARMLEEQAVPPETLEMTVIRPDRTRAKVELKRNPFLSGTYEGNFTVTRKGSFEVEYGAGGEGRRPSRQTFDVKEFTVEFNSPRMNREGLEQVASLSGGEFLELADVNDLVVKLKRQTEVVTHRVPNPLLKAPLLFFLFCGLICVEWIVRKRFRLM